MIGLKEEILEKIIKRAAEVFKKNPEELSEATRFAEDLQAKSVNIVQITTVLEVEYDIEIPYMEFRRKKTFGEAAEYIKNLVEG
jgi:acyl carrier protein